MTDQEFDPNWVTLALCAGVLFSVAIIHAWMDVSFEIEKRHAAEEYRP